MSKITLHTAEQYALDVIEGRILACEYVKLACRRYFYDKETCKDRGFYFDERLGMLGVGFFSLLEHYKAPFKGKAFDLQPWQQFIMWNIFGWIRDDGSRRFRDAYIEIARKNGKTTLAAGVGLKGLVADFEDGAEVYTAATTKSQANICFKDAKIMSQRSSGLKGTDGSPLVNKYQYSLVYDDTSKMEALAADAETLDGLNPHIGIIDEYHAHPNSFLYDVIKSGMGARVQPLQFTITTAGFNIDGPCYEYRKYCIDLLEGKYDDDSQFAIIYTLDEGDDWKDPANFPKAHPNYRISSREEHLLDELKKALKSPVKEVNFRTKYLNQWMRSGKTWIQDHTWMAGQREIPRESLKGLKCYGGLDLSSVSDICALTLEFPMLDGEFLCLYFFWLPEETANDMAEKNIHYYTNWTKQGFIFTTPGNVIDYGYIRKTINELGVEFKIQSIAFDKWNSTDLVTDLIDDGFKMNPFSQAVSSMNSPTKEFEKLVLTSKLQHGNNPVMRWMMGNVLIKSDANENAKINKKLSTGKVDGPVSNVMAHGEYMTFKHEHVGNQSVYSKRGIRTI